MIQLGRTRRGRSWGRTIVLQAGDQPAKGDEPPDVLLGHARTVEDATLAVDAINTGGPVPGARWWCTGCLVFKEPGADLTSGWIIAMDHPEDAAAIVHAVNRGGAR